MMVDHPVHVKMSMMPNVLINFMKNFVPNVCIPTFSSARYYSFFFCSSVDMASPGWDASLSEHVLKNLRGTEIPFNEKDLQDNLTMLEMKLR